MILGHFTKDLGIPLIGQYKGKPPEADFFCGGCLVMGGGIVRCEMNSLPQGPEKEGGW